MSTGGGGGLVTNFKLLILSPNLLKFYIPRDEGFAEVFWQKECQHDLSWPNRNGPYTLRERDPIIIWEKLNEQNMPTQHKRITYCVLLCRILCRKDGQNRNGPQKATNNTNE